MSNFNKWNRDENLDSDKLNVVLFVSRNKDNKHLKNFTERRNAFTTTREFEDIKDQFKAFVEAGQPGEFSRMYYLRLIRCLYFYLFLYIFNSLLS